MDKSGWTYKRLDEVCDKGSSNVVINKLDSNEGNYPLFGASGIVKSIDFYHQDKPYIGIVKDGSGVGRVNIYPAYSALVGTMQYILPKDGEQLKYIKYFLEKLDLSHLVTGAAIPHIYFKDYGKKIIPLPSKETQKQIVEELDAINESIDLLQQQAKDLDVLAQSIYYDMFGDPIDNPKDWNEEQLGGICEVSSAKRVFIEEVVDSGIPFIRGTELTALNKLARGEKMNYTLFITKEHYEKLKAITGVPKVGDLLIPSINSEGIVWQVDTEDPLYFKDGRVLWVHVNEDKFESDFLQKTISILIRHIFSSMNGATFAELKLFVLRDLMIPVPPLSVQQSFSDQIEVIENAKYDIRLQIADMQNLLASRMQYWFD